MSFSIEQRVIAMNGNVCYGGRDIKGSTWLDQTICFEMERIHNADK